MNNSAEVVNEAAVWPLSGLKWDQMYHSMRFTGAVA